MQVNERGVRHSGYFSIDRAAGGCGRGAQLAVGGVDGIGFVVLGNSAFLASKARVERRMGGRERAVLCWQTRDSTGAEFLDAGGNGFAGKGLRTGGAGGRCASGRRFGSELA